MSLILYSSSIYYFSYLLFLLHVSIFIHLSLIMIQSVYFNAWMHTENIQSINMASLKQFKLSFLHTNFPRFHPQKKKTFSHIITWFNFSLTYLTYKSESKCTILCVFFFVVVNMVGLVFKYFGNKPDMRHIIEIISFR